MLYAATQGYLEAVKKLSPQFSDTSALVSVLGTLLRPMQFVGAKRGGTTPLIEAAGNGHTEVVARLLETGAKPDVADGAQMVCAGAKSRACTRFVMVYVGPAIQSLIVIVLPQ